MSSCSSLVQICGFLFGCLYRTVILSVGNRFGKGGKHKVREEFAAGPPQEKLNRGALTIIFGEIFVRDKLL